VFANKRSELYYFPHED